MCNRCPLNSTVSRNRVTRERWRAYHALPVCFLIFLSLAGQAQEATLSTGDCTAINLVYNPSQAPLTNAEINALRDKHHRDSLNQFERCVDELITAPGNGGGSGAGGGSGRGSTAASGVTGTGNSLTDPVEPPAQQPPTVLAQTSEPLRDIDPARGQGRSPIDIPPADSDGALAAQIRRAAEAETNPQRRDRLWNEYRKITGLPAQ